MELINNINQCKNIIDIFVELKKIRSIKCETDYIKILNIIYKSNKSHLYNYINISLQISNKKKYYEFDDMCEVSCNLIKQLNLIKHCDTIEHLTKNIILLNNTIDEFEANYYKIIDPVYKKFLIANKNISLLLQIIISNKKYPDTKKSNMSINEILNIINQLYSVNPFFAVQLICKKSTYLMNCDINLYNKCWDLVCSCFKKNNIFVIYILLVELRKIIIESTDDPVIKKFIYYNIDIDSIKQELQFTDNDHIIFIKYIDIFKSIFNLSSKDIICFDDYLEDFSKIYFLHCSSIVQKSNILNLKLNTS